MTVYLVTDLLGFSSYSDTSPATPRLLIALAHTSGFHLLGFSHLLNDRKEKKKKGRELIKILWLKVS